MLPTTLILTAGCQTSTHLRENRPTFVRLLRLVMMLPSVPSITKQHYQRYHMYTSNVIGLYVGIQVCSQIQIVSYCVVACIYQQQYFVYIRAILYLHSHFPDAQNFSMIAFWTMGDVLVSLVGYYTYVYIAKQSIRSMY